MYVFYSKILPSDSPYYCIELAFLVKSLQSEHCINGIGLETRKCYTGGFLEKKDLFLYLFIALQHNYGTEGL